MKVCTCSTVTLGGHMFVLFPLEHIRWDCTKSLSRVKTYLLLFPYYENNYPIREGNHYLDMIYSWQIYSVFISLLFSTYRSHVSFGTTQIDLFSLWIFFFLFWRMGSVDFLLVPREPSLLLLPMGVTSSDIASIS